ncbi:Glycosyl hydrolase family 71 [Opitutaceae bacterium TAV1]|nr:Glycosyl hydrolase family 71 [Opitutaceae bacterium TAV1]
MQIKNRPTLRNALLACGIISLVSTNWIQDAGAAEKIPWAEIDKIARDHVAAESPASVWPFEQAPREQLAAAAKKSFPHYFTPNPLSFANQPPELDNYTRHHLTPDGEGGKYRKAGGYLRQRPLPIDPHDSPWWEYINFAIEIHRARAIGQDGFAADILSIDPTPPWGVFWTRQLKLMETAAAIAPDFHIMIMPDMNAGLRRQPEQLERVIETLAASPAAWRLDDGRVVVSNFLANARPPEYWKNAFDALEKKGLRTAFLPVFLGYHNIQKFARDYAPISWGMSDWGFRDLADIKAVDFENAAKNVRHYTSNWMMPVAPQDFRPKAMQAWEAENTSAFRRLWEIAINGGSNLVQLITWNDYGEGTEISPSTGTQFLYYDLCGYYTTWFKLGRPPAITKDAIYYCHRVQTVPLREGPDPEKQPKLFQRMGGTPLKNEVELLAMLTAPAVLEIEQNGKIARVERPAGVVELKADAEPGRPVFRILRDGKKVVELPSHWTITDKADYQNLLYHGGSSTRRPIPGP